MSEFTCNNHHLMSCSDRYCRVCGEPIKYMDGYSKEELKRMEEEEDRQPENEGEESDD